MTSANIEAKRWYVTAVILSYHAPASLRTVIEAIRAQTYPVSELIVVDNGSKESHQGELNGMAQGASLMLLPENLGVGEGHNVGWRAALQNPDCDFIWSLEHDCFPAPDCLAQLVRTYEAFAANDAVGAVLPIQVSGERSARRVKIRLNSIRQVSRPGDRQEAFYNRHLTFNGVLFPVATVRQIGFLNSSFFVGQEDREYSQRLRKAGFRIVKVPTATIQHEPLKFRKQMNLCGYQVYLPGGGSVLRAYYATRNDIALHARGKRNRSLFILKHLLKFLLYIPYTLMVADRKRERILARFYAIRDGFSGNLGRKDYSFLGTTNPGSSSLDANV